MLRKVSFLWLRYVHPQLALLIATIGIVGLSNCLLVLFILGKLFLEVWEHEAFAFDTTVLLWMHQFANPALDAVMLKITELGNPSFVVIVVAISFSILWWRRDRQEARLFAIACLGAFILNTGLKLCFTKQRPQLWHSLIKETSYSFPSGHALGSLVLYGLIAYFLATNHPKYAKLIYSVTALLIIAIGVSRLYLGVHWVTDIIAGYGVGVLWLTICIYMLKIQKLQQNIEAKS